ncbi:hypothetical protein [Streptomyces sp. NPDC058045]|uniref:hypothetical protein n=1 Tax=Streptomyces sp. NPDC058045 TaxID=3346311 RepID=UPI0036E48612
MSEPETVGELRPLRGSVVLRSGGCRPERNTTRAVLAEQGMTILDEDARVTVQSILYACADRPARNASVAASSGLATMRSKHGDVGATTLSMMTAARVGGLWRRYCSEPPTPEAVARIMRYGFIHTPLRRSLLEALTALVTAWEAVRPTTDIRLALKAFDMAVHRFST